MEGCAYVSSSPANSSFDGSLQVKRGIAQDPRYDAVGSATRREELFNKFKDTFSQKSALATDSNDHNEPEQAETEKRSKSAKRERALKERESQVRAAHSQVEREIGRSRGRLGREEAEREFGTVLTDAIRDPLVSHSAIFNSYD